MSLSPEIDAICDEYSAAWKAGQALTLSAIVNRTPTDQRTDLLKYLIPLDIEIRRQRGLLVSIENYRSLGGAAVDIARAALDARASDLPDAHGLPSNPSGLASPSGRDFSDVADFVTSTRVQQSLQDETDSVAGPCQDGDTVARIGRYEIRSVIGEGNFGRVYAAFDTQLLRTVAIKIPRRKSLREAGAIDEFLSEARLVAGLDHRHIVPILDVGVLDNGRVFVVTKLINGESLRSRMDNRSLPTGAGLEILAKIAEALHCAHKQGLVHRDVKPGNILVASDLQPCLIDFGLALSDQWQQEMAGEIGGSPAYMSPEQAAGLADLLDGRSDIWSLGVILYELLTGRRPFTSTSLEQLFREIRDREPKPPRQIDDAISPEIEQVCLRALAKPVSSRFTTAMDFAAALRSCIKKAIPPTAAVPQTKRVASRFVPPDLPPHYICNQLRIDEIVSLLIPDKLRMSTDPPDPPLGIEGRGGLGKSVLMAAVARDPRIPEHFPDGIFWITVGQDPNLLAILEQLLRELGAVPRSYADTADARHELLSAISDKRCLLILDDIWDLHHAKSLLVQTSGATVLATTRDARLLTQLGFRRYSMHALAQELAISLLSVWSGELSEQLAETRCIQDILRHTGHLPLALAVCGGMRRDGHEWQDIAEALSEADLEFLSSDAWYAHESVMRSLAVGIDFLTEREPEVARACLALAVFPPDTWIPRTAAEVLWASTHAASPRQCRKMLVDLHQKNLINLDAATGDGRLMLHDLQHDYLQLVARKAGRLVDYHQSLLDGYRRLAGGSWSAVPDDGYFFEHAEHHLQAAQRHSEVTDLLRDINWLERKLEVVGVSGLLETLRSLRHDSEFDLLYRAVQLSIHAISRDPRQLRSQLAGRLIQKGQGLREHLLATPAKVPWLECLTSGLDQPGAVSMTLRGHTEAVLSVFISQDGTRLLSGSADNSIRMWDLRTGGELAQFTGHRRSVTDVKMTPDGTLAVSSSIDGTVRIWDVASGKELIVLKGHSVGVAALDLSADGRLVVSAGLGGQILAWTIPEGRLLFELSAEHDPATGVSSSSRGKLGNEAVRFRSAGSANDVCISPCGSMALVGFNDHCIGLLRIFGESSPRWLAFYDGHSARVHCVAWLSDGQSFLSGSSDRAIRFWKSGACWKSLSGHRGTVSALSLSHDDNILYSGSSDRTIQVWDLRSGEPRSRLTGHASHISDLSLSGDGRTLVSASHDHTIKVWNTAELTVEESPARQFHHHESVTALAAMQDGSLMVSGAANGNLMIHDLSTGEVRLTCQAHQAGITALVSDPYAGGFLSASADHTARLWDNSGTCRQILEEHTERIWNACISPDGHFFATASDDATVRVWKRLDTDGATLSAASGSMRWVYGYNSGTRAGICFTSDSRHLIFPSFDHRLHVWNIHAEETPATIPGHSDFLSRIIPLHNNRVVTSSYDGSLMLWRFDTELQFEVDLRGHSGSVRTCEVTPDQRHVISASSDRTIRIWNLTDGAHLKTLTGHTDAVSLLSVSPDGTLLTSVADNGEFILWDLTRGEVLCRLDADTRITCCHLTNTQIVAGDDVGRVHIYRIRNRTAAP